MLKQLPTLTTLLGIKLEGVDAYCTPSFTLALEYLVYETLFTAKIPKFYDCISIHHRKDLCMLNYRTKEGS